MFGSLGWSEMLLLFVVALVVFGPDKLPQVARDAGRMLRQLREMAQGARTQLKSELGPEFSNIDLDSLNPKTFVRKHLLEDGSPLPDLSDPLGLSELDRTGDAPRRPRSAGTLPDGERPPYDPEAT